MMKIMEMMTGYNLQSWNRIKGSGFDFKLGAIIRPFEYSPFRIGASYTHA